MTDHFLLAYGTVRDAVLTATREAVGGSGNSAARAGIIAYVDGTHNIFQQVPAYYYFLVLKLLPGPEEDLRRFFELSTEISAAIEPALTPISPPGDMLRLNFMHIHVVVWTAFAFWTPLGQARNGSGALTEKRKAMHLAHTVELCLHGHFPRARHDIPYHEIERIAAVRRAELLEPNRFFAAVEAVVAEVGFEAASLERIAGRLGISKSSLYFHFENKGTMFSAALQRERGHFRELFERRVVQLDGFSSALYGYLVSLLTFLLSNRSLMVFSNWAQIQHIPVSGAIPEEEELLQSADFLHRRLAGNPDPWRRSETLETIALLSILVQRGIIVYNLSLDRHDELFQFSRALYRTVTHGIVPRETVDVDVDDDGRGDDRRGDDGRGDGQGDDDGRGGVQTRPARQVTPGKGRTKQL